MDEKTKESLYWDLIKVLFDNFDDTNADYGTAADDIIQIIINKFPNL